MSDTSDTEPSSPSENSSPSAACSDEYLELDSPCTKKPRLSPINIDDLSDEALAASDGEDDFGCDVGKVRSSAVDATAALSRRQDITILVY